MKNNLFITRGISKENRDFVYGYYVNSNTSNRHFIITEDSILRIQRTGSRTHTLKFHNIVEISQEPDRWTGIILNDDYHDNQKLWENDICINKHDEIGIVKYQDYYDYPAFDIEEFETDSNNISHYVFEDGLKIIGNTHFNKVEDFKEKTFLNYEK